MNNVFEYGNVFGRRVQFVTALYSSLYSLLDGANSMLMPNVFGIIKRFAVVVPNLTGTALTWLLVTAICGRYSSISTTVKPTSLVAKDC
jgi:hypothetical protein